MPRLITLRHAFMLGLMTCLCLLATPPLHAQDSAIMSPPAKPNQAAQAAESTQSSGAESQAQTRRKIDWKVGWLSIDKPLRDRPSPFAWVSEEDAGLSLAMAVQAIDRISSDATMRGLVIHLDAVDLTLTQIDALTQAIARAREAGKPVMVFSEAYDMRAYLLASACDRILLQHNGRVELHGLGVEEMYLAGLLGKLGVQADFMQVGRYKGADETLTRTGPSDAWNENFDALLTDLYAQVIRRISQGRGLSAAEIEQLFVDVWSLSDVQLVERKVVDQLCDRSLAEATSAMWGDDFEWVDLAAPNRKAAPQNPLAMFSLLFQERTTRIRKPTLAVVWAMGQITSGESQVQSPQTGLFGGSSIGSKSIVQTLEDARDNDMIKGVVIYVDSPGGSALASELMWQAVRDVVQYKPVYVVVGPMAASGGYYIACAADQIYVSPSSIVGSIGVVGGKIVLGDLYEKLGISIHHRSRGPMGDMFNSAKPFTAQQREAMLKAFTFTYEQFLNRVTTGRGDRLPDINAVSQGRLFTGQQAVVNGMADKLGGVKQALADLAKEVELSPGQYETVNLPAPMNFADFLDRTFGGVQSPAMQVQINVDVWTAAKQVLGPNVWRSVEPVLGGLMQLQHEPVLTIMPTAVIVR